MPYGDASFRGNGPDGYLLVGVEIKTVADVIASFLSERLQEQVAGMVKRYQVRWLAIIGEYREGADGSIETPSREHWKGDSQWRLWRRYHGKLMYAQLEGALDSFEHRANVRIKHLPSEEACARWLAGRYNWWQKPWASHQAHLAGGKQAIGWSDEWYDKERYFPEHVARQVPGLGIKMAELVAKHFGTVETMVDATTKDWDAIAGIGPVLAGRCHAIWRRAR